MEVSIHQQLPTLNIQQVSSAGAVLGRRMMPHVNLPALSCQVNLTICKDDLTSGRRVPILPSSWDDLTHMKTNLRRFRFERGELSQQQLADMVGVSRQTIVSIERGDYAPSVKLALLLAKKLKAKVEDLFILEGKDYV